jgi:hypothetical protein
MYPALRAAIVFVSLGSLASAQSQPVNVWVSQGRFDATITATRVEPYLGGDPYAGIPIMALEDDSKMIVSLQARVRAWPEGDKTRVIVFAVQNPAPAKYLETPVATFLASPGDPERVVPMEDFGGAPVRVRVAYK